MVIFKRKNDPEYAHCRSHWFDWRLFVAKPDAGMFNQLSLIGLTASFLAAMAFVTVRALTATEPPERIVFYFCFFGTLISMIPMSGSGVLIV
jgi:hypothetical protein